MTHDVVISDTCVVRKGFESRIFELRVGTSGWHKEAALLTKSEAKKLMAALSEFMHEGKP